MRSAIREITNYNLRSATHITHYNMRSAIRDITNYNMRSATSQITICDPRNHKFGKLQFVARESGHHKLQYAARDTIDYNLRSALRVHWQHRPRLQVQVQQCKFRCFRTQPSTVPPPCRPLVCLDVGPSPPPPNHRHRCGSRDPRTPAPPPQQHSG